MLSLEQYKNSVLFKFVCSYKLTVLGFLTSMTTVVFLSSTMLADAIYFDDPEHKDMALEAWMTPKYIALSYDLPRDVVISLLDIDLKSDKPRRLDHLADNIGVSLTELTGMVRAAAATHREQDND